MTKRVLIPLCAIALVLSLAVSGLADTIRLKDGSVIRGEVIGFKDQQFTVLVGGGGRGRRSTLTLYMEDVESIEFEGGTGVTSSTMSANDDDTNAPNGGSSQPSTQTSTQLPRPTPSRPASQNSSSTRPPATTTTTTHSQPIWKSISVLVKGDATTNGWTSSGYTVRKGQRIRITATGQISLGNGRFSQPSGISTLSDKDKLMQDEPTGALLAVVGDDNNDFVFIGRARDFVSQRDGVLFLGINEGNLNDNTGSYNTVVEVEVPPRTPRSSENMSPPENPIQARPIVFEIERTSPDKNPEIVVKNDSAKTLDLSIGELTYEVSAFSSRTISTAPGNHKYHASALGVIPATGENRFDMGYRYSWTFWIETVTK